MPTDEEDNLLNLTGDTQSHEDIGEEVERTNTELEKLKRKLDDIGKQKIRLEEIRHRQDQLESGRNEMGDKLLRGLATIEREQIETQKRLEQLGIAQSAFAQHLRFIDSLDPKSWNPAEISRELSTALSAIDDARADYNRAQLQLEIDVDGHANEYGDEKGFFYWLQSGFAFTLPLMILLLFIFLTWTFTGK